MKKETLLITLFLSFFAVSVSRADWSVQAGTQYYITNDVATGWLALGAQQGDSHALYYQTAVDTKTDDAYWLIEESGNGYTIQNNYSGEYLSWSDDYDSERNLCLATSVSGDEQRWTLNSDGSGGIIIRSLYNSGYHLNVRTSTLYAALYSGATENNSVFHIWEKDSGEEVTGTDEDVDSDALWSSAKRYVIKNANGFGYLVYDPELSDEYPSLKGYTEDAGIYHESANELYNEEPDLSSANSQWVITSNSDGYYSLYNLGMEKYIHGVTSSSLGIYWAFTETVPNIEVTQLTDSTYAFRMQEHSYDYQAYMCAASQFNVYPIRHWETTDAGSQWLVMEAPDLSTAVMVESIEIDGESSMEESATQQLTVSVLPAEAEDTSVTWSVSDKDVLSVTSDGLVTALLAGTASVTATANDGSGVTATFSITVTSPYLSYGDDMLYLRHLDSTMTVLPETYISEYSYRDGIFKATLINGEAVQYADIQDVTSEAPSDLPSFSSYKFNNKYNPQVFTDAEATDPTAQSINISVAGIGRWLTASFQVPDSRTEAYVLGVRQRSKKTRQSFADPVTYVLTNPMWSIAKMRVQEDNTYTLEILPYERRQKVTVTFLTDQSTNDYIVPRIDITLVDADGASTGTWGPSNYIDSKTEYKDATITIQGGGVFPDMEETPISIKGRGNSTWTSNWYSKNPYHFKFASKQKPLGMTAGKHWILLSNKQDKSMTTNAVGMRVANMFGTAAANHIVPVELYINDSYRGSYNLTEKVGFSNNSVDLVDETSAALIEMDTYTESDGTVPDYSNVYGLAVKVKEPEVNESDYTGTLTQSTIISDINSMMSVVNQGDDEYIKVVDPDYLARYLSANELILNRELSHPKSVFFYSEDVTNDIFDPETEADTDVTPWIFGPVWDCDWSYGYEGSYAYYISNAQMDYFASGLSFGDGGENAKNFWNALRYNSEVVDSIYYQLWTDVISYGGIQELQDFCDDYYAFAKESFAHNQTASISETDKNDYSTITTNSKSWLEKRMNYIYSKLTAYTLTDDDSDSDLLGDVNDDGVVSVADMVSLLNYIASLENETFVQSRADVSGDGAINASDEDPMAELIWAETANANRNLLLPGATISIQARSAVAQPQSEATVRLQVEVEEGSYSALQMDVTLPTGTELNGVKLPSDIAGMSSSTRLLSDGKYRVIIYANGNTVLPSELCEIGLQVLTADAMEERVYLSNATASTSLGEEERLPSMSCRLVVNETLTDGVSTTTINSQSTEGPAYDLSGRRVNGKKAKGVYIQDGKKYVR